MIAHEFGHYILHRHQQDRFECGDDDIETGDGNEQDIEIGLIFLLRPC